MVIACCCIETVDCLRIRHSQLDFSSFHAHKKPFSYSRAHGFPTGMVGFPQVFIPTPASTPLACVYDIRRRCTLIDYECAAGNLRFSNINMSDDRAGLHYVCIVQNTELRSLMQGDDQKIEPVRLSGTDCRHE